MKYLVLCLLLCSCAHSKRVLNKECNKVEQTDEWACTPL